MPDDKEISPKERGKIENLIKGKDILTYEEVDAAIDEICRDKFDKPLKELSKEQKEFTISKEKLAEHFLK